MQTDEMVPSFSSSQPTSRNALGFPVLNLGINNQKYALFGLLKKAQLLNAPVILPNLSVFGAKYGNHQEVPFRNVFSVNHLRRFAKAFDLEILDHAPIATEEGWDCFIAGTHQMGQNAANGIAELDNFTCQYFRNLVPLITKTPLFSKLSDEVYKRLGIKVVCQLRIEHDWLSYSSSLKDKDIQEDYSPSFQEIMEKIANARIDGAQNIYVVCDEANLPVSKEEIRQTVLGRHGINLVWKSDILNATELSQLSSLDLSVIDFEISVRAPIFIGTSLSTFSNLAAFEAFCRTGMQRPGQYLYNARGQHLVRRFDCGVFAEIQGATNRLYERAPLISAKPEDCQWPALLLAHVSRFGDISNTNTTIPGIRRGPLVCGVRGNSDEYTIEGFSAQFTCEIDGNLEYRAKLYNNQWTDWVAAGSFVGTHGMQLSIKGFAVRLTGKLSLDYHCICVGSFVGRETLVEANGESGCFSENDEILEAMQIVFRPRSY